MPYRSDWSNKNHENIACTNHGRFTAIRDLEDVKVIKSDY